MSEDPDIWELRQQNTLIARLHVTDQDMFWHTARFEARPAFEAYRAIFALGNTLVGQSEKFNEWYKSIKELGMYLIRLHDKEKASEFILYVENDIANFRPRFDKFLSNETDS